MSNNSQFFSGPHLMRKDLKYATPQDVILLRQRVLNLEESIKELKAEIENLKNK